MTRSLGRVIPDEIARPLDGSDLAAQEGFTPLLVTTEANGWAHVAMLSAGELLVIGDRVRMALWPTSTATADLDRSGQGLLYAVVGDDALGLRMSCRRGPDLQGPGMQLAAYECEVVEAFSDKVGYAVLRSGISFTLTDRERDLPRWSRTIAALAALDFASSPS